MLLTLGGRFSGYGLFVEDNQLVYHYNLAGIEGYDISAPLPDDLPTDTPVTLKAVYKTVSEEPGAGAEVALYANDQPLTIAGSNVVCQSIANRFTLDETLDVSFDTGTPIRETYAEKMGEDMSFDFTGTLNSVTIELTDDVGNQELVNASCPEPVLLNPVPFYD